MTNADDQFQVWLMDMSDAIERFRQSVSTDIAARLDFSPESLDVVEQLVLAKYPALDGVKKQSEAKSLDGIARYVGQVFREHFGGKWMIDFSDEKNVFYGLPQLVGMAGQRTQMCPLTTVTASVDRRTKKFIRTIFENYVKNASKST